jgi:hypothetical protein
MHNHINPDIKTLYPPYISASRPKGRIKGPVTSEKTLAGQVRDSGGISRTMLRVGTMTVKSLIKYSYRSQLRSFQVCVYLYITAESMDPRITKQNPVSAHQVLNISGHCLPIFSISLCV